MSNFDHLVEKAFQGSSEEELLSVPLSELNSVQVMTNSELNMVLAMEIGLSTSEPTAAERWEKELSILLSPSADNKSLQRAWVSLQVYCCYALKLPASETDLKSQLHVEDFTLLSEPLANNMVEKYSNLHNAGKDFLNNVYDKIVSLGNDLQNFAKDATATDGSSIFQAILDCLNPKEPNYDAALELLQDRIDQANTNSSNANEIITHLTKFSTSLKEAEGGLEYINDSLKTNLATSQKTMNDLSGGIDIVGSIKNINTKLQEVQNEYSHDVAVAATTPTYAWVIIPFTPPIPAGLIAAVVVASVFGSRAVSELNEINELKIAMERATTNLQTAVAAHAIQERAKTYVSQAILFTNIAIQCATTLQGSWNSLANDLKMIAEDFRTSIIQNPDGTGKLKAISLVKVHMQKAIDSWTRLKPVIDTLMDQAYIAVRQDTTNWEDFKKEIEDHMPKKDDPSKIV
jgi:hypothetical protein